MNVITARELASTDYEWLNEYFDNCTPEFEQDDGRTVFTYFRDGFFSNCCQLELSLLLRVNDSNRTAVIYCKCEIIIVWGEQSKQNLEKIFTKYSIKQKEIIDFQEKLIDKERISFKKICRRNGIVISKALHHSMNDCEYLVQVIKAEIEKNPTILYGEEISQNVVIARLCSKLGLNLRIKFGFYFVYTNISSWYFNNDGKKIVLHHENFYKHNNRQSWANAYHIQDKQFPNAEEVIRYIYQHDKGRYRNF